MKMYKSLAFLLTFLYVKKANKKQKKTTLHVIQSYDYFCTIFVFYITKGGTFSIYKRGLNPKTYLENN